MPFLKIDAQFFGSVANHVCQQYFWQAAIPIFLLIDLEELWIYNLIYPKQLNKQIIWIKKFSLSVVNTNSFK